jgi:acyl carrier protein
MEAPSSIRFLKRLQEIAHVSGPFFPSQELSIDLGLDSLTLVQITVVLENEFGLQLREEDLPGIRNIGDVLRLIREAPCSKIEEPNALIKTLFQPPSKPLEEVFNLERGIFKRIVMRIIQIVVFIFVRVVLRMRIEGMDKISVEAKVPIIPILIEGAANTLSPLHPGFNFAKINIVVGGPIEPPVEIDHSRELYQEVCARWKDAVEKLENQFRHDLGKG